MLASIRHVVASLATSPAIEPGPSSPPHCKPFQVANQICVGDPTYIYRITNQMIGHLAMCTTAEARSFSPREFFSEITAACHKPSTWSSNIWELWWYMCALNPLLPLIITGIESRRNSKGGTGRIMVNILQTRSVRVQFWHRPWYLGLGVLFLQPSLMPRSEHLSASASDEQNWCTTAMVLLRHLSFFSCAFHMILGAKRPTSYTRRAWRYIMLKFYNTIVLTTAI